MAARRAPRRHAESAGTGLGAHASPGYDARVQLAPIRCALVLALTSGCSLPASTPSPPAEGTAVSVLPVPGTSTAAPSAESSRLGLPLSGPPRLVIENHSTAAIDLYGGYLVDEEGKLGTMALWPHPRDCPDTLPKTHLLPLAGIYELAAPSREFDTKHCAPGAELPAGRYVVHIDSGYGAELYASAQLDLPLTAPVRLEMRRHDKGPACTPVTARRAARLALAAAKAEGAADALLKTCNPAAATCGTLPLEDEAPPTACTLTLHEQLLRARFAPAEGQPKEMTAWLDHDAVFARRPDLSRSTAAAITVAGQRVVFEGVTRHHWHVHGGEAARVGGMQVRVFNATKRALPVKVTGVEWQTDHSCGKPVAAKKQPAVTGFEPKSLPPGTSVLSVSFDERGAYQAHCDVFASRATLTVEGQAVSVVSEHAVGRFEPMDVE